MFIEKVNVKVHDNLSLKRQKNARASFRNIKNSIKCVFMELSMEELYQSTLNDLSLKAINHARTFVDIISEETDIILHLFKILTFHYCQNMDKQRWPKNF